MAALFLAIICGGVIAYLLLSDTVTIQRLDLVGAQMTPTESVIASSGVAGHNIFTVDAQRVADRLLTLPTVQAAEVWVELPDQLVVRVVERQPALVWQVGSDRYLLDAGGAVIAVNLSLGKEGNLPGVAVSGLDVPQVGGRVDRQVVTTVLTIYRRAAVVGLPVIGTEYQANAGLTLILNDGRRVLIGDGSRLDDKLAAAAAAHQEAATWRLLIVTDPDRPFVPSTAR